jgi:hypothetical protein
MPSSKNSYYVNYTNPLSMKRGRKKITEYSAEDAVILFENRHPNLLIDFVEQCE